MNAVPGCQNASAGRSLFAGRKPGCRSLLMAGVLVFLCGLAASLQAQTALFNGGLTTTINASLNGPMGVTTDASGNMFVADNNTSTNTATVYKLTRNGPGNYGTPVALPAPAGGFICPAAVTEPDPCLRGIAVDSHGNLWVAAFGNYPTTHGRVYEWVNTSGTFATPVVVGTSWKAPWGVAADPSGNVFVTDNAANTISEISIVSGTPMVTTAAAANVVAQPRGIAVDANDILFVIDGNQDHVMEVDPPYSSENLITDYSFQGPGDLARDAQGNLWLSEFGTNLIREAIAANNYDTIPGWGSGLNGPVSVWPDSDGTVLVSDFFNHAVKLISTAAVNMGTVAAGATSGAQTLQFTFTGTDNTAIRAPLVVTQGAAGLDFVDAGTGTCTTTNGSGNPYGPEDTCTVDVKFKPKYAGVRYGAVKLLDTSGTVLATGYVYGAGSGPQLDFGLSAAPTTLGGGFSVPEGITVDSSGNIYLADAGNNAVKKIPPGCVSSSCVTTLGGGFANPTTVALDGIGNLYVADTVNRAVKMIPPGCASSSCVTTLGGGFTSPGGVAVDGSGNIYVSDTGNNAIYRMPSGCASNSCVTTVVGETQPAGLAVDGNGNIYAGLVSGAVLEIPQGCTSSSCVITLGGGFTSPRIVTIDAAGSVYVADFGKNVVDWMPSGCASSSCVSTLDGAVAKAAGVALDGNGNVYVTSIGDNTLVKLTLATPPSLSFAGTHAGSQSSDSPKSVTLRNIGNAPLTFPVPGTGTNPSVSANFTLDSSTTCPEVLTSSSAGTLAAGGSCNLAVDFIPTTTGSISGSAVLTDNNLNASPAVTQSIGLSGTGLTKLLTPTVTVTPSPSSITTTQGTSVTVTVSGGNGNPVPTGTVSLSGPGFSSTQLTLSGGSAIFNISADTLSVGTDTLTTSYSGDSNYNAGTGSTSVTVTKATPTVTVTPNPSAITTVQSTVVTVSVAGTPQPTGTITLTSGGVTVGSGALASGAAQITVAASALALGTDTLTASYSGDGVYNTATGSTSVTVTKATPTVTVTPNPSAITTVQSSVVTVSVAGTPQPTGTITLTSGGVTVGSGSLSSGTAQITVSASVLALGVDTVTASYSGDGVYNTVIATTAVTVSAPVYPDNNLGSVNLGSTNTTPITITFNAISTLASTAVVTQGASGLDFTDAGTGSCATNGSGHTYNVGDTCTVNVIFAPKYAGARYGAANVLDSSGNVVATAYMYGTGVGPQLAFGRPTTRVLGGPFTNGTGGMAVDGNGNVYVANLGGVSKVPPGCGSFCMTSVGGGFRWASAVAVDGAGNIYVADAIGNAVKQMPPGCVSSTCVTTLGGGFNNPGGVAVDGRGNIYVADAGNGAVKQMPPACDSSSCVTTLGGGFTSPSAAAVDAGGNVYVADGVNHAVDEIPAGCASSSCVTKLGGGFGNPTGVAVDKAGNVYATDNDYVDGKNAVYEIPAGCVSASCVAILHQSPDERYSGVTVDGSGNVYAGASGSTVLFELDFTTPPSLSFAKTQTGSQSSDSPKAVTLRNIGNAPLTFPVPGSGQNPSVSANFTLDSSTTCPEVTSSSSAGTLAAGASCNLAVDFAPATSGQFAGSVTLTDNNLNASPSTTQSIALSGETTDVTDLAPWIQVNNGPWQQTTSVSVNAGATVNLAGSQFSGGTWSWTGPGGFTASTREIDNVSLPSTTNVYNLTYTNTSGVESSQAFSITVNATPVVPWLEVNGGPWQQASTVAVNLGAAVNLAGQNISGGTWSWTGPGGFTSTSREIDNISLPSGTTVYNLTYTNASGVASSPQAFTITVNATPVVPWLEVNGAAWQQTSTVTANLGSTVNLAGQNISGGTWSWTGPGGFTSTSREIDNISLPSGTNVYNLTYTNASGVASSPQAFTITVNATPVVPWLEVNGGAWQQASTVAVNLGATVNLAGQNISGGTWSWTGPGGFTASTREIDNISLPSGSNVYTLTYTNTAGATSAPQTFTITINATAVVPYLEVNGGAWQQASTVAVNVGATVNLAGQNITGGTWSWTGPGGFTASTREIDHISLPSGSNVYTLTYTNTAGATSAPQTFTITINATAVVPWIEVNGGAWQQTASASVNTLATVNLAGQNISGGTWSWTGPNGFTSTSREIDAVPLTAGTNVYTLKYTNVYGVQSSGKAFTITAN